MTRLNQTARLVLAGLAAALLSSPRSAAAQGLARSSGPLPAAAAPSAGSRVSAPVTLQLRETPLRTALETLFQGTGLQHAVEPAVPDYPITLSLRDVPFDAALRTLLRLAPGVIYRKEGEVYIVGMRPPAPPPTVGEAEPPAPVEMAGAAGGDRVERIPLNYIHPAVLAYILNGTLVPSEDQVYAGLGASGGYGRGLNGYGVGGGYNGAGLGANGLGSYANGTLAGGSPGYGINSGGINNPGQSFGPNAYFNPGDNSAILAPRARRF